MAQAETPTEVKRLGRDARVAVGVHILGLVVAGAAIALVWFLQATEQTSDAISGVGCAAGGVLLIWSLVLACRVRKGESLRLPVIIAWVVLSESAFLMSLLVMSCVQEWAGHNIEPSSRWILLTSVTFWLVVLWIATTVALPCTWLWVKLRQWKTRQPEQRKSMLTKFLVLWVPIFLLLLPVGMIAQVGVSPGFRKLVPPGLTRCMPGRMQLLGMAASILARNDTGPTRELIISGYLSDNVVMAMLNFEDKEFGLWLAAVERLTKVDHDEYFALVRSELQSQGATCLEDVDTCLRDLMYFGSQDRVREFIPLIADSKHKYVDVKYNVKYTLRLLKDRDDIDVGSEMQALLGHPNVPQDVVLGVLAHHMATDEWQKLYREKAKGDVSERVAVGESLRMLDGLKGIEDLAIALLHDPEPDVRGAALGLYPRRLGARVFCEYLKCLKDEDVRVRRKATHMLGKWTGFDNEVSGLLKLGPDAVETPEELALRAKIIKAVEERKDDKQSNE